MAKANTKAGADQLSQDIAATEAAQQETTTTETTATEQPAAPTTTETTTTAPAATEAPATPTESAPAPAPAADDLVVKPVAIVAPVAPVAPKAAVANPTVINATKPVVANASVTEQLAAILKDVPAAYQIDLGRVQTYIERMAPKRPVDSKVGVGEQVALYRAIQNIVNRQEQYFTQLFSGLLFLFKAEGKDGALSDRYRMRFMDNITLHVGDRKAFANITQLLHIVADPKSRKLALTQVNLERALENGLTAEGRKRVLDYLEA